KIQHKSQHTPWFRALSLNLRRYFSFPHTLLQSPVPANHLQKILHLSQRNHIRSITQGLLRLWVCLYKESIYTNRRSGPGKKWCKLTLTTGRAAFAAGLLYRMGYIED